MDLSFETFESFLKSVELFTSAKLEEAQKILEYEGKDIDTLSDIFISDNNELFEILPDGSLIKVNLYIATKNIDKYSIGYINKDDLYKYHIYKCTTISQMFNAGRKHRYKLNSRDDGTFYYIFNDFKGNILKIKENQKLNICKNCLGKFRKTYSLGYIDVGDFNLKEFHKQKSSFFDFDTSSLEKGEDAKPNVYSRQWNKISKQLKERVGYTCEGCGWKPKDTYQKRFVHTHHQNGDKTNNKRENLKVLCIGCHANVDSYHSQIKKQGNYREFLSIKY